MFLTNKAFNKSEAFLISSGSTITSSSDQTDFKVHLVL